jgi:glycosyltransferase involved in cell wall biosynthesis
VNIAVDARELAGRPTGVGRYLAELLERWAADAYARRHQWRFFAHEPVALPPQFQSALTVLAGRGGAQWEQGVFSRALRRDKPDVLFAPGYSAPLTTPAPIALTIHDVSFFAHPEWFSFREGIRRRTLTAWAARRSRLVLTDSQFSRDEIVRHIGIPATRVRVVPLGLTRPPRVDSSPQLREPVILYVGSIFRRRHVDTLIEVFVNQVAPAVPASRLEIVGENRLYPPGDPATALRHCPPEIAARVTLRSYVDESTLGALYARSMVFAFLSEYEGFGFTPLEALAAGVPPIVLDTPVAREVYGPAACYVEASGVHERLGQALIRLLTSEPERAGLLAHADAVLERYDWSRTASATLRAIEEAAGV